MKSRIIIISAMAALATMAAAPAWAGAGEAPQDKPWLANVGVVAGGVLGAVIGGPPGAIAGMAVGGIATDRELTARHANALEERQASLQRERLELLAERGSLKTRVDSLARSLAQERDRAQAASETVMLADGIEFDIPFRSNSAVPPEGVGEGLQALAMLVQAVPSLEVRLDGYADPRGGQQLNQALSQARAEAIRDRLVAAGVAAGRIRVAAHGAARSPGSDEAAAEAFDPDGWALQRRVSIQLESREGRLASQH